MAAAAAEKLVAGVKGRVVAVERQGMLEAGVVAAVAEKLVAGVKG